MSAALFKGAKARLAIMNIKNILKQPLIPSLSSEKGVISQSEHHKQKMSGVLPYHVHHV